jgi:siderophore synthetase component
VWNPKTDEAPFGMKVSLDAKIGGTMRNLSQSQIERSAASSALINTFKNDPSLEKEGIIFQDEPFSVYLKDKKYGFSYRDLPPITSKETEVLPMFSLYSTSADGGDSPIIKMIRSEISKFPGRDKKEVAKEFIEKTIIEPLSRHYTYLSLSQGFVGEPHEQNVSIELKEGMPTGKFYYKDLAGFHINPEMRKAQGLDMSFLPKGINPRIW